METTKIKTLLQKYFEGETSPAEEKLLENYFKTRKVDKSLQEYAPYFDGISELNGNNRDRALESDIMDYILENETKEKSKYRWLWQTVTGVAASIIIVLGGFLYYQQQKTFDDTFKNPDEAYAYAVKTLGYVSGKYNKGLAGLSKFDKLQKATEPVKKGFAPVNEFYQTLEKLKTPADTKAEVKIKNEKSNDSI
jgi:hypothetical protein